MAEVERDAALLQGHGPAHCTVTFEEYVEPQIAAHRCAASRPMDEARRPGSGADRRGPRPAHSRKAEIVILTLDVPFDTDQFAPRLKWVQAVGRRRRPIAVRPGLRRSARSLTTSRRRRLRPDRRVRAGADIGGMEAVSRHWSGCSRRRTGPRPMAATWPAAPSESSASAPSARRWPRGPRRWACGCWPTGAPPGAHPSGGGAVLQRRATSHALLAECDAVVLCRAGDARKPACMFNAERLRRDEKGRLFLQCGAGFAGRRAGADRGADLRPSVGRRRSTSPPPNRCRKGDPLWTAPNLAISPHSAASVEKYFQNVWAAVPREHGTLSGKGEPLANVMRVRRSRAERCHRSIL